MAEVQSGLINILVMGPMGKVISSYGAMTLITKEETGPLSISEELMLQVVLLMEV